MKIYTFGDICNAYGNGYSGKFKNLDDGRVIGYGDDSYVQLNKVKERWVKVHKEITPIEAIKLFINGKTVYSIDAEGEMAGRYHINSDQLGDEPFDTMIDIEELTDCRWYVEEE